MKAKLKLISGIGLLILGVLGIILPIMPGIPFLLAGAAILGTEHPLIRPFKKYIDKWRRAEKSVAAETPEETSEANRPAADDQNLPSTTLRPQPETKIERGEK